ncbi:MAG: class I SAM-dependent methyltransferase [Chloroflexota bacterium]|nr:class I SAM-dependent methyltransferase [Chloroflexota bacterium]
MTTGARCRVCGSAAVAPLQLEEMMFGSREPFEYLQCATCGSLSIAAVPADLSRHYPATYYSFTIEYRPRHGHLARRLAVFALLNIPRVFSARLPSHMALWRAMRTASVGYSTRVLDVGCGNGALLRTLRRAGFRDLNGVDPFVKDSVAEPNLTITKGELKDLDGAYAFVLMCDSLEHMPDPGAALREVARLCAPGGHILISIPVVNRSWAELGPDWVELDPPRHLFIPSVAGLSGLIGSVPSLELKETMFDTTALEIYDGALTRKRVPLCDPVTGADADPNLYFSREQLDAWSKKAREYVSREESGRAHFLVQRV